jgi:hypothetical protein
MVNADDSNSQPRVIKISVLEYQLPCAICRAIAVSFKVGIPDYQKEENLIFSGITHRTFLGLASAPQIFSLLAKEYIREVNNFYIKHFSFQGIDAYCPQCDRIYCARHYDTDVIWDEGFYDCTYGICPQGHRRMIDD